MRATYVGESKMTRCHLNILRSNLEKCCSIQICHEVHISQGPSVPRYIAGWCNYKYQIYRRKKRKGFCLASFNLKFVSHIIIIIFNEVFLEYTKGLKILICKGQLISKANCQAVNSSKKRINDFIFTTMRRVFVWFLEEI